MEKGTDGLSNHGEVGFRLAQYRELVILDRVQVVHFHTCHQPVRIIKDNRPQNATDP